MTRTDIINSLIKKFKYKTYLEIGTRNLNNNFNKIKVTHKVSVDPSPIGNVTFVGTSDEYFKSISNDIIFDIIFIDGLHYSEQVDKDIENSLKHLSKNGTIICHDCLPTDENMQNLPRTQSEWTGDVWKSIAKLRVSKNNLEIFVIDTDYGCGIIRNGNNIKYIPTEEEYLTYNYFKNNKNEMMNAISKETFIKYLK